MALTYHRARWHRVKPPPPPPPSHPFIHTHTTVYKSYTCIINTGSLFLIGGTVPSSTEHGQDSCSMCYSLIYRTVSSFTREDTVVANATIKKVNEQDAKTFSKCYVGRNGKRNQQKLHIQVCGSLKTQRNQGCHRNHVCA